MRLDQSITHLDSLSSKEAIFDLPVLAHSGAGTKALKFGIRMAIDADQIQHVDAAGSNASSGRRIGTISGLPPTGLGRDHIVIGLDVAQIDGDELHGTTKDPSKGVEAVLGDGHVHEEGGDDSLGVDLGRDGPELHVGLGADRGYPTPSGGRGAGGSRGGRSRSAATSVGSLAIVVVVGIVIKQIAHLVVDGRTGVGPAVAARRGDISLDGIVIGVIVGILIVQVAAGSGAAGRPKTARQVEETNGTVREAGNDVPSRGCEGKTGACGKVHISLDGYTCMEKTWMRTHTFGWDESNSEDNIYGNATKSSFRA